MLIDFEKEAEEIITKLAQVEGYLDCEKIIIHNIKKQVQQGFPDAAIEEYAKKLLPYLEELTRSAKNTAGGINYLYSAGFLKYADIRSLLT